MFIARDENKKIFAPLGAKPDRRLAAKVYKYILSHKHFAPTPRGQRTRAIHEAARNIS
jgi:hypothetical protein